MHEGPPERQPGSRHRGRRPRPVPVPRMGPAARAAATARAVRRLDRPAAGADPPRARRSPGGGVRRLRAVLSRRRWRIVGALVLVAGLFLSGFFTGWSAHTLAGPPAVPDTTVELVPAPTDEDATDLLVPDVRGLTLDDARQAVADAGTPPGEIDVEEAPSALPAGTVTAQDPIGGSTGTGAVTLTVAVAGKMPDLVGQDSSDAAQTLLDLGVRAVQESVYDPDVEEGTVLAVDPAPGKPLAASATMTVAGPASSVFLAEIDATESACGTGPVALNGEDFDQSLTCSVGSSESSQVYLLDRQVAIVNGAVGITDDSDPATAAVVRVIGDGKVLWQGRARYGERAAVEVPVRGVLRLEIRWTGTNENAFGTLGLGDFRAVGSPDGVASLAAE